MVTDGYSHILDDDRRNNAQLFENAFYSGAGKDPARASAMGDIPQPTADADAMQTETTQADAEMLLKLLQKPELAALLKTLTKSL